MTATATLTIEQTLAAADLIRGVQAGARMDFILPGEEDSRSVTLRRFDGAVTDITAASVQVTDRHGFSRTYEIPLWDLIAARTSCSLRLSTDR